MQREGLAVPWLPTRRMGTPAAMAARMVRFTFLIPKTVVSVESTGSIRLKGHHRPHCEAGCYWGEDALKQGSVLMKNGSVVVGNIIA